MIDHALELALVFACAFFLSAVIDTATMPRDVVDRGEPIHLDRRTCPVVLP